MAGLAVGRAKGGNDLAERNPAVIWRQGAMPMWRETRLAQAMDRSFRKIPVLEAASGECHVRLACLARHPDDDFGEGVMHFGSDHRDRLVQPQIR